MQQQKIDLDALEAALAKATPGAAQFRVTPPGKVWDTATALLVLPALIAELRELRARTTPEVIGEKHRDGNWWLCWEPWYEAWYKIRWQHEHERWQWGGGPLYGTPTHALPLPGRPDA